MQASQRMRCCFCGESPDAIDYVQLATRMPMLDAVQYFGAHSRCLSERFASGFTFELPEM